jgi:hypothetical protein
MGSLVVLVVYIYLFVKFTFQDTYKMSFIFLIFFFKNIWKAKKIGFSLQPL